MTFLTPLIAALAAAVAIPTLLILYFLKLRRRDVEVSSTLLWRKTIQDLQANAPFQKLRRNLLLFLQLLVLFAALFALAQPQRQGMAAVGTRHIIMIDRSASMSSVDAEGDTGVPLTRLERSKRDAESLVASLREGGVFDRGRADEAMVIAFDRSAEVLQTFTSDKDALRRAIDAIEPSDAPSSVTEAFLLARAHAPKRTLVDNDTILTIEEQTQGTVGTIHLWTDGRLPDADRARIGPEDRVVYHAVGSPEAVNVGITTLRAVRAFDDPTRLSVYVGLQSTDRARRRVDVELLIDGLVTGIKSVAFDAAKDVITPGPDGSPVSRFEPVVNGVVFDLTRPEGALVTINLRSDPASSPDVLAADNTAWLVVPPAKKARVAVVTRGNLFIAEAVEALPLAELRYVRPEQAMELFDPTRSSGWDVVILDGWLPPALPDAPLPPGRFLIINALPPLPWGVSNPGMGGFSQAINWKRDHPALRGVSLDNLVIFRTPIVTIPAESACVELASSDLGPVILELAADRTRAILLPFDLAESRFPFDVAFVVFMAQAIAHLADDGTDVAQMIRPGSTMSDRLPIDARAADVRLPNASVAPITPAPDGTFVFGPVRRSGVYSVSWTGSVGPTDARVGDRAVRPFAANLLDAEESNIGALPALLLSTGLVEADAQATTRATIRYWPWLILAALAVMMFEWWIYNRRVYL